MSSEPWNLGSEKSNATLQLRQDYIYDALNEHLIGSGIVDATTFAAFASYLGYGSGGSAQDMQVAWTPTNLKLGERTGFVIEGNSGPSGVTSLSLDGSSIGGITVINTTDVVSVSGLNITAIDPLGLLTADSKFTIGGNTALTSVNFPVMAHLHFCGIICSSNPLLTSLSFPALVESAGGMEAKSNSALTSFSAPNWVPSDFADSNFSGDALPVAEVDSILHKHVLSPTWGTNAETLLINGGTNAAPSSTAPGSDYAILVARGATVTVNP